MTDTSGSDAQQGRLDDLQDRIDDVRKDVNDGTALDDEPRFIDNGSKSDIVDNTIAPPG